MDRLKILKELIADESTVELVEDYSKYKCVLNESASDYCVEICNIPMNAIVIKVDNFNSPNGFFRNSKMECKRADFIIVVEEPEPQVLFIELKRSGRSSTSKEIIAQLKGAYCAFSYCEKIISEFWSSENIFEGFEKRYYVFYSIPITKSMTYEKPKGKDNLSPDKARHISDKRIQYRKLIS